MNVPFLRYNIVNSETIMANSEPGISANHFKYCTIKLMRELKGFSACYFKHGLCSKVTMIKENLKLTTEIGY